jgi:cellulose synthase/poly-beta-1,6-N-acetylglucosamine synthase-like glycosyltransferase
MSPAVRISMFALRSLANLLAGILAIYTVRRLVLTLGMFVPARRRISSDAMFRPDVLVLAACRNESAEISELCRALDKLRYPVGKCRVVLVDDGSSDATPDMMAAQERQRSGWRVLRLPRSVGKAAALNAALAESTFGEIVYVIDADHRPQSDALSRIVRYFEDPLVGGVTGRTIPRNPVTSPSAYYATIECDLHQLLTMRGKDRLDLGPAVLGSNCAYRRSALVETGGFRPGALLEDYDLTLRFYCAGYRTHFGEDVVAYHEVPDTLDGYLKQHTRWGRGFYDVAGQHATRLLRAPGLSFGLRLELLLSATGYLDRVALFGAVAMNLLGLVNSRIFPARPRILVAALAMPLFQVVTLLAQQHASRAFWIRLPVIPIFLLVDVFAALRSLMDAVLDRPRIWTATARSGSTEMSRTPCGKGSVG